jgi:hypothetical protein
MIERARLPDRHPAALRLISLVPGTKNDGAATPAGAFSGLGLVWVPAAPGKRSSVPAARQEIESSAKPKPLRRRHGPRLLEWERQAILDAYRDGEKVVALCAEFGVACNYPRSLARRRGFPVRIQGRPTNKPRSSDKQKGQHSPKYRL